MLKERIGSVDLKTLKPLLWTLFVLYILLLVKVIIFKYPLEMIMESFRHSSEIPLENRLVFSNFIPFESIGIYTSGAVNGKVSLENLLGNILAFLPLGFLLPFLKEKGNKLVGVLLSAFILSLAFELIQFLFNIGSLDIDDLILNVSGALIGYLAYLVCLKILRVRNQTPPVSSPSKGEE